MQEPDNTLNDLFKILCREGREDEGVGEFVVLARHGVYRNVFEFISN